MSFWNDEQRKHWSKVWDWASIICWAVPIGVTTGTIEVSDYQYSATHTLIYVAAGFFFQIAAFSALANVKQ